MFAAATKAHSSGPITVETCPGAISASKPGCPDSRSIATAGQVSRPESSTERFSGAPSREHRRDRRRRRLEAGGEEHDGPMRVLARDAHGLERRGDRAYVGAGGLRLLERADLALVHVHRHAQHVAERDQGDRLAAGDLDRLVDGLLRAHAHRAAGAGNELDALGQRAPQARPC